MRTESLQTCFHLAVHNKHMDVLMLLLDSMETEALEIGDENLRVPLHFCAYSKNFKVRKINAYLSCVVEEGEEKGGR